MGDFAGWILTCLACLRPGQKHQHGKLLFMAVQLGFLWCMTMLNEVTEGTIAEYCAIRPHTLNGLLTVFTSPFVHGSFEQMAANTLPFGTIGFFVLTRGGKAYCMLTGF